MTFCPVTFPLWPVAKFAPTKEEAVCSCWLGADCARVGKHAAVSWRSVTADNPSPGKLDGGGVGLKTGALPAGSGIIAVDIDTPEAAKKWDELGGSGPTRTIRTGRPGLQFYFQHPGFHVGNSQGANGGLFPGIDIRGDGGMVVMPGSPHYTGRTYTTLNPDVPIAPCPAWLIEWFKSRPTRELEHDAYEGDVDAPAELERRRKLYIDFLKTTDPCVEGRAGDRRLFDVVQYGAWDLALPSEDVFELIEEHFDPRCEPPWGNELEERVLHKCHTAKTDSRRPRKAPMSVEEEQEWGDLLAAKKFEATEPSPPGDSKFSRIIWGGWSDTPLPPSWLIEQTLLENKVTMLYAEPGGIKTWLAISMAIAIAAGRPWLDERAVQQGKVLYVDFEDGRDEFHRRVHMLSDGEDVPNLGYWYWPARLDDPQLWKDLAELKQAMGLRLIVLDTLATGTPGINENERAAADALIYAGKVSEDVKVTMLFLHHANKAGGLRGTTAFSANVDTLYRLEKTSDKEDEERAKLSCVKSGQKKGKLLELKLTDDGGLEKVNEEDVSKPAEDSKEDKRSLEDLRAEILLLIEKRGPFASYDAIRMATSARKSSVSAVMSELAASGDIARLPEGWIRDNESLRRERVREAILSNRDATRTKLLALACITKEQFDRLVALGHIRPSSSDPSIPGFVWSEKG